MKIQIPIFKAKEKNGERYFEGYYFRYPRIQLCLCSKKEWEDNLVHCLTHIPMVDWNFSNSVQMVEIDKDTLQQVRYENLEIV